LLNKLLKTKETLKNGKIVFFKQLEADDNTKLYNYLSALSEDTKKRFGPHNFDLNTVNSICENIKTDNIKRFVALDDRQEKIIAYSLIKIGLIEEDIQRYNTYNINLNPTMDVTYAPSVADEYQSCGLGSALFNYIINEVAPLKKRFMVLWGGVQATNTRAVNYYIKHGFIKVAEFSNHHGLNFDMYKNLTL